MNKGNPLPVVVFAQVPPPEHGQSRMVKFALAALRASPSDFQVHHINARFSESLGDIGETSLKKGFLIFSYLFKAIRVRFQLSDPLLYYVPGPAKWSAVLRDWLVLSVLRIFYRKIVFHWHAIGQGEWAHGSDRVSLGGFSVIEPLARKISAFLLEKPFASIAVSETSAIDSKSVGAEHAFVVCNGIDDPCCDYDQELKQLRRDRLNHLKGDDGLPLRILFLSHGTEEKGLLDSLSAIESLLARTDRSFKLEVTFAGGVSQELEEGFTDEIRKLKRSSSNRIKINLLGYQDQEGKNSCFREHDIFLSASRWESFGLTTVEAMAFGMVVVAVASDGVRGVLPSDYPYLSTVGDTEDLSERLEECWLDILAGTVTEQGVCTALRHRFLDRYQIKDFAFHLRSVLARSDGRTRHLMEEIKQLPPIKLQIYLADQNPGYDRSFGISRMSKLMIEALGKTGEVEITTVVSKTSQKAPNESSDVRELPWGTRGKIVRFLTDHFHPLLTLAKDDSVIHYFPKGYLPFLSSLCRPSVVTIHDAIIQYDEDHYPKWRSRWAYRYWAFMLKHTLRNADFILTVSESSRQQIKEFMRRHRLPAQEIIVTYEPCAYEDLPQPVSEGKGDYVIHLASVEPHKRTAQLIDWWNGASKNGRALPELHLIGSIPPALTESLKVNTNILKRPRFMTDSLR